MVGTRLCCVLNRATEVWRGGYGPAAKPRRMAKRSPPGACMRPLALFCETDQPTIVPCRRSFRRSNIASIRSSTCIAAEPVQVVGVERLTERLLPNQRAVGELLLAVLANLLCLFILKPRRSPCRVLHDLHVSVECLFRGHSEADIRIVIAILYFKFVLFRPSHLSFGIESRSPALAGNRALIDGPTDPGVSFNAGSAKIITIIFQHGLIGNIKINCNIN